MGLRIKICGLTELEDAQVALEAGADYLGFIFFSASPRSVTVDQARYITDTLRTQHGEKMPYLVGVFVNEQPFDIEQKLAAAGLDLAQLSGEEPSDILAGIRGRGYKAIRPQTMEEAAEKVREFVPLAPEEAYHPAILVDSFHPSLRGGTGELGDSSMLSQIGALSTRMMLAGGLTPENVAEQVRAVRPFGVDVASGVEASKGKKSPDKVRAFIQQARAAAEELGL